MATIGFLAFGIGLLGSLWFGNAWIQGRRFLVESGPAESLPEAGYALGAIIGMNMAAKYFAGFFALMLVGLVFVLQKQILKCSGCGATVSAS